MKICLACATRFDNTAWRCPSCGTEPTTCDGFPAMAPEFAHQGGGFRPEYFQELATLEAQHFWFRARNRVIVEAARRHFPTVHSFLEVGCGTGYVLSGFGNAYPDARLTGTEIFSAGLGYAARRVPGAEFLQVDARRIPFDAHFELVGAFDVLEHIAEDESVLAQMHRAIEPGGGLIVTVPQHPRLWSRQDELACHVRRYTATELRRKTLNAGFELLELRSFVSLLLPVMWLSRRRGLGGAAPPDPMAELRLHPSVNRLLAGVMEIENALFQIGVRFPAGASLLLVARRN